MKIFCLKILLDKKSSLDSPLGEILIKKIFKSALY